MNLAELLVLLEKECHTRICVEAIHESFQQDPDLRLTPDQPLHHSPFCRAQKLADGNLRCSRNKQRSLRIAALGRSFCGRCPYGVRELVQPVMRDGKLAAVCYFTIQEETGPLPELRKKAQWLAEWIRLAMLKSPLQPTGKQRSHEFYRKKCIAYLDLHYAENIGAEDLAQYLGIHPAYFSMLFKTIMKTTFRKALTERRIREAEIYLRLHRNLSITSIGRLCGFSDSNYFSLVFHRLTGQSPKEYRQNKILSQSISS